MHFANILPFFEKNIKDFFDSIHRVQSPVYDEIMTLFNLGIYDKCQVLQHLVRQRLHVIKDKRSRVCFSLYLLEKSSENFLDHLAAHLKKRDFPAVIEYINNNASQFKNSPQLSKLLQTFFSVYTYFWSHGNQMLSESTVKELKLMDIFSSKMDLAVRKKLQRLQKLNQLTIDTHEGRYELACILPDYISLINIIARGHTYPSFITQLSDLLLRNITNTCDIEIDHFFMSGFIHIIPYLNEQDKNKWIDLLRPFTEELLTHPDQKKILKQVFNRSFLNYGLHYGVKRLIKINIFLHNPQLIPKPPKHLNGFESKPLHKNDPWTEDNQQNFLQAHFHQADIFSVCTLDEKIGILHSSCYKKLKSPESHYCMHLYDLIIEESQEMSENFLSMNAVKI